MYSYLPPPPINIYPTTAMVTSLRDEAINLGISACVDFVVNAPYSQLHSWLSRAAVGLHTMWNEHFGKRFSCPYTPFSTDLPYHCNYPQFFAQSQSLMVLLTPHDTFYLPYLSCPTPPTPGISIVEMMAAGLVIVAHNSGGPLTDIVRPAHPSTPHLTSSTTSLKKESKGRVTGDSITGDSSGGGGTGEVNDPGAEADNSTSPEDNSTGIMIHFTVTFLTSLSLYPPTNPLNTLLTPPTQQSPQIFCIFVGYLATTPSEYAQCMATVLDRYQNDASGKPSS